MCERNTKILGYDKLAVYKIGLVSSMVIMFCLWFGPIIIDGTISETGVVVMLLGFVFMVLIFVFMIMYSDECKIRAEPDPDGFPEC